MWGWASMADCGRTQEDMPRDCHIGHFLGTIARPPARSYFALDEYPGNGRYLAPLATFNIFGGNWHRDG
jgi:hypothetical protein